MASNHLASAFLKEPASEEPVTYTVKEEMGNRMFFYINIMFNVYNTVVYDNVTMATVKEEMRNGIYISTKRVSVI